VSRRRSKAEPAKLAKVIPLRQPRQAPPVLTMIQEDDGLWEVTAHVRGERGADLSAVCLCLPSPKGVAALEQLLVAVRARLVAEGRAS
jgi:hypothetical protein